MATDRNLTMGRIIAKAWSEPGFLSLLTSNSNKALKDMQIAAPSHLSIVARESTNDLIHLVLSAPPSAMPISALSEIRDFAEIYRDPRLWSLNWRGRDPVATKRMLADPKGELAKIDVACPDDLTITVLLNTAGIVHLIIPPRPPDRLCTPDLLSRLSQGHAPASLRFGRLFGTKPYTKLLEAASRSASQGQTDA